MKKTPLLLTTLLLLTGCIPTGPTPAPTAAPTPQPTETVTPTIAPSPTPEICITSAYILNLREDPNSGASIIMWLEEATPLTVIGQDGDWLEVITPKGRHGHVHSAYCK